MYNAKKDRIKMPMWVGVGGLVMDRIGQERVGEGRDVGEGRGREGRLGGEVQGAVLKLVFKQ